MSRTNKVLEADNRDLSEKLENAVNELRRLRPETESLKSKFICSNQSKSAIFYFKRFIFYFCTSTLNPRFINGKEICHGLFKTFSFVLLFALQFLNDLITFVCMVFGV